MFEGKILAPDEQMPSGDATGSAEGLVSLNWSGLTARLTASHDFRRIVRGRLHTGAGSFNCTSARHLAMIVDDKREINPFDLGNGKMGNGMDSAVSSDPESGDRGRQ